VVQTVDSARLARRLDQAGRPLDVMLEVKLSAEEAKSGADPADLPGLIDAVRLCPNLRLLGLMTMPPWSDNPEVSRPYFRRLRDLGERHGLKQLSMGMSHDLEAAIEEGATCVRVGTALFGARKKV
jgi:pyridoxal phosphate enzyme (YggS family)